MPSEKENIIPTAYDADGSREYDQRRFTTRQGLSFDALEWEQLSRAIVGIPEGSSVLEVGCGTGRFSRRLATREFIVRAVDPSPDMIKEASEKCRGLPDVTFALEEAASLSSEDSTFDLVFAIRVTNQTESEDYALRMVREMIRVTKPGGSVLVEFVNKHRPLKKPSKSVRLSFTQIANIALQHCCRVESRRGILVFSQTILETIPLPVLPAWLLLERLCALAFWRWASRGYILLRKC